MSGEREEEVLKSLRELGVWSHRKRKELASILLHHDPPHFQRCFLAGFLRYAVGLSVGEVVDLIERYCAWRDYNRRITERNVRGIHKSSGPLHCNGSGQVSSRHKGSASRSYEKDLEILGSPTWVGRCCGNGYCLEWHREFLLG